MAQTIAPRLPPKNDGNLRAAISTHATIDSNALKTSVVVIGKKNFNPERHTPPPIHSVGVPPHSKFESHSSRQTPPLPRPPRISTTPHEGNSARSRRVGRERGVCGVARLARGTTTGRAARLAPAPSLCQRGSRRILRQAPRQRHQWISLWDDPILRHPVPGTPPTTGEFNGQGGIERASVNTGLTSRHDFADWQLIELIWTYNNLLIPLPCARCSQGTPEDVSLLSCPCRHRPPTGAYFFRAIQTTSLGVVPMFPD
jgi:hypothetical protein